jgi:hypothetical protein
MNLFCIAIVLVGLACLCLSLLAAARKATAPVPPPPPPPPEALGRWSDRRDRPTGDTVKPADGGVAEGG